MPFLFPTLNSFPDVWGTKDGWHCKGAPRIFHWDGQDRRAEKSRPKADSGPRECSSSSSPPAGESGQRCELPSVVRPRPPKGFPLLSALRMAYPDTIILLIIVDYLSCSHREGGGTFYFVQYSQRSVQHGTEQVRTRTNKAGVKINAKFITQS